MHHTIVIFVLLLLLIAVLSRSRAKQLQNDLKKPCESVQPAIDETSTLTIDEKLAPTEDKKLAPNEDEKLALSEEEQLKQALALRAKIEKLRQEFVALPAPVSADLASAVSAQDQITSAAQTRREHVIATEQIRIAQSFCDELMRFVLPANQNTACACAQHKPSFNDAAWAFTAAHLTLTFAQGRVTNLSKQTAQSPIKT